MKIRTIINSLLTIAVVVAASGCLNKKSGDETGEADKAADQAGLTLSPASIKEVGIRTETVTPKHITRSMVIPAKVIADQDNEAIVGSLVEGRVCKVFVKAGDRVQAGSSLMLIEGLEIGEIKAAFITARANTAYQKANYERQKKLFEEDAGAQKNLLESKNEYEKAMADYNAQKNRINAIGLQASDVDDSAGVAADDRTSGTIAVRSPISGIVVERNVVIGQPVEATTTAFKIINLSSVCIDGQMYEKGIGTIDDNSPADFIAASFPGESFRGSVLYVGKMIDEETRTITVRAQFGNTAGKLLPQMFGELKIPAGGKVSAILLPAEAVVKIENADYVFVATTDTTFEKRPVTTGHTENETVEIAAGLTAGEAAVVKGAFYLKSELLKASFGEEE